MPEKIINGTQGIVKRAGAPCKNGFILPIVIIVGLIIGAGLMALSARTFASLMGSIRQGQSREAREIPERVMAIIFIPQG